MTTRPRGRLRRAERAVVVRLAAALLTAAAMTACASAPPADPPAPPVPLPERWAAGDGLAAPEPPEDAWWTELGGAPLAELVAEALGASPSLAAAAARVEAAAAQARIAGADVWPQVGASFDASRRRQNFLGFPIPGADERGVLSNTTTSFSTGLDVSWEIDLWGRLRAGESAAVARLEASAADLAAARLSLAGQVAKAWFGLLEAVEQTELAGETAANRELSRERVRRRYELGLRPGLDLRLAIVSHATAEALAAQRERQLDASRRRLEALVVRYPDGTLGPPAATGEGEVEASDLATDPAAGAGGEAVPPAGDTVPDTPGALELVPPGPVPAGVPAEVLLRRPDLAAAERRLAAAGLAVEGAEKALLPRITLTGSAGRSSQDLEDLLDDDFTVWSVAAGLLQPIFQGGRLRAAVDVAEARQAEALALWRDAALRALTEVEQSLAADAFLAAREAALEEAAAQAAEALETARERYAAGLVDYLTVLESERQALDTRSQLLAARRERLDARVDLHLALGGGFPPVAAPASAAEPAAEPTAESARPPSASSPTAGDERSR